MTEWEQTAIMGKNETHFMRRRGESNIMIRLHNDYNRGACAKILEKLAETNAMMDTERIPGVKRQRT